MYVHEEEEEKEKNTHFIKKIWKSIKKKIYYFKNKKWKLVFFITSNFRICINLVVWSDFARDFLVRLPLPVLLTVDEFGRLLSQHSFPEV